MNALLHKILAVVRAVARAPRPQAAGRAERRIVEPKIRPLGATSLK